MQIRWSWVDHGPHTKSSRFKEGILTNHEAIISILQPFLWTLNCASKCRDTESPSWFHRATSTCICCQHLWERTAPTELIWLNPCVNVCQICVWFSCWPAAYTFCFETCYWASTVSHVIALITIPSMCPQLSCSLLFTAKLMFDTAASRCRRKETCYFCI